MKREDIIFDEILNQVIYPLVGHKHTTYTNELDDAGKILFGTKYKGAIPYDHKPSLRKKDDCCILNLDNSNQSGSHWVGLYNFGDSEGRAHKQLLFDSFGRKTSEILPDLKIPKNVFDTEYDKDQKEKETDCGQRCLAWLCICKHFGYELAKKI